MNECPLLAPSVIEGLIGYGTAGEIVVEASARLQAEIRLQSQSIAMEFASPVDIFLAHVVTSTVFQIFLGSSAILVFGLALLVWLYAVRLSHVEAMPLSQVERMHPQLPKIHTVTLIIFCHACVFAAVMVALLGRDPFAGPYQWVALLSALFLSAGASLYAELKRRGTRAYAAGIALGTAIALLLVTVRLVHATPRLTAVFAILLLLLAVGGSVRLLLRNRLTTSLVVAVLVTIFWITAFSLPIS